MYKDLIVTGNLSIFNIKIFLKIFRKFLCIYFYFYDRITYFKYKPIPLIKNPKKLLISNIAGLGDGIVNTSIIPIIKKHFPKTKICFLGNCHMESLLTNHPLIDKFFNFNHIRQSKKQISLLKKIIDHYKTKRIVIKQMKKEKIDIAIDFFFYNPNSIKLLYKAKIPNIIGYTSCGYKNLLTLKHDKHIHPFWHMSEYHLNILNTVLEKKEKIRPLEPNLPNIKEPKYKELTKYENFILIHPGAGYKIRYLNSNQAKQILNILPQDNTILFVGLGEKENNHIKKIIGKKSNCINLANKLHLLDLVYLCKKAKMIITTDSAISHIASNFDNPQIIYFKNPNILHQNLWCLNKPNIQIAKFESGKI